MFGRKKLKSKIAKQEKAISALNVRISNLQQAKIDNQELRKQGGELRSEVNQLKAKIRTQTEADLFFVSSKICLDLLKGKTQKEIEPLLEYQRRARQELAQMRAAGPLPLYGMQQSPTMRALWSPFGGLL